MNEIFRPRKFFRNIGIVGLFLYSAAMVLSIYFGIDDVKPDMKIWFCCVMIVAWGGFDLLSLWCLLAYWREQTIVSQQSLTAVGVLRSKEIDFSDVEDAHWRCRPSGGSIVLRTQYDKKTIDFGSFEWNQRDKLIRLLKNSLPDSVQRDWKMFCYKIALPVTKPLDRELEEGEVRVTRRRWDLFFVLVTIIFIIVGVILWKWQHEVRLLSVPVVSILLWMILRFSIPKDGMINKRISALHEKRIFYFLLAWGIVGLGLLIVFNAFEHLLTYPVFTLISVLIVWFAVLLYRVNLEDQVKRQRNIEAAEETEKEWKLLEEKDDS